MTKPRPLHRDTQYALTRGKLVVVERAIQQALRLIRLAYKEMRP